MAYTINKLCFNLYFTGSGCQRRGNTYRPVPGTRCSKFTQSAPFISETHSCPWGLMFNTEKCVCDYQYLTKCEM